jgi:deoxyuridine 5'-triphosphate nucleotidohydrolase
MFKIVYETQSHEAQEIEKGYMTDSGYDAFAPEIITLRPDERQTINLGIKFKLKLPWYMFCFRLMGLGIEAQIRPKSGRTQAGIDVKLGTIDEAYTGYCGVTVVNTTRKKIVIEKDKKICQIVFVPVFNRIKLVAGTVEDSKTRGSGGFGSTGIDPKHTEKK